MYSPTLVLTILPFDTAHLAQACRFAGEFDKLGMEKVGAEFLDLVSNFSGSYFIVDLEQLHFINSEGIGVLIAAYSHATKIGAKFFLVRPDSHVRDILQTLGLWDLVGHSDSIEQCFSPPLSP
jgi:stage II sporulation protein AA (anti-sigma F factor antagonist)